MDIAALLSASTDYEYDEEEANASTHTRAISSYSHAGGVDVSAKASAVVAFKPDHHQSSSTHANRNQSISPYTRPLAAKSVNLKHSVTNGSPLSSGSSDGVSSLALVIASSTAAPVKNAKPPVQPQPQQTKRIRKRKLSAKQMKRWLEKEAEDSQIYNLTLDVNELKQQLQYYELQKSLRATRMLVARQNFSGGAMHTTNLFFKIFQRGLREWDADERSFIQSSLDEQLALGTAAFGRQVLMEQWARYTTLFQIRSFVNSSVNLMSNDPTCIIVQCVGQFEGRLSRQAIETIFPHILHDEELMKRVLESKFVCPATTFLYFDARGTIVRYDAHADIFEGLNMLLAANPRDVITMIASARIGDASMIPSDRDDDDIVSISSPPPREERFTVVENKENVDGKRTEGSRHSVEFLLS